MFCKSVKANKREALIWLSFERSCSEHECYGETSNEHECYGETKWVIKTARSLKKNLTFGGE